MNNKGQILGIIAFIVVIISLVIIAPVLMKIVTTSVSGVSTGLASVDQTNKSSDAVNYIGNTFTNTFDWVVAFFMLFNIIILLVSSFLVDVHPAFIVIYIIAGIFLFIFAPTAMDAVKTIYQTSEYTSSVANLPVTEWVVNNFGIFLLSVFILSGLIMFGKLRYGSQSGGTGSY